MCDTDDLDLGRDRDLRDTDRLDFKMIAVGSVFLKPFVCLKMFRFTLLIFFLDRLLPLELTTEADRYDFLADLKDADLRRDFLLFVLDLLLFFLPL